MAANFNRPLKWKEDIARSVDMYNQWFLNFAPETFRSTREEATTEVLRTLSTTDNLRNITPSILRKNPEALRTLRMSTCPPLAVNRLIGLASVKSSLVNRMEKQGKLPSKLRNTELDKELSKLCTTIERLMDLDIFWWIEKNTSPSEEDCIRAAMIVADRLCGSLANPVIRNEQERRQLKLIASWLDARGYTQLPASKSSTSFREIPPGTYAFRMNVPVAKDAVGNTLHIPVDAVVMRQDASPGDLPILIEAKSAGDFTNTNKRRKEEAQKMVQLKKEYGDDVEMVLFLCGYFNAGYLGYEAAEGIDWVWEHRIDDFQEFAL